MTQLLHALLPPCMALMPHDHAQAAAVAKLEEVCEPQVGEQGAAKDQDSDQGPGRPGATLRPTAVWRDARTLDRSGGASGALAAVPPMAPSPAVNAAAVNASSVIPQTQQQMQRPATLGLSRKRILTETSTAGAPCFTVWLLSAVAVRQKGSVIELYDGMQAPWISLRPCADASQEPSSRRSSVAVSAGRPSGPPCERWRYSGSRSTRYRPASVTSPVHACNQH